MSIIIMAPKELPDGFRVWMVSSKHAGMLQELRKVEKSENFLAFLNSSNIPSV